MKVASDKNLAQNLGLYIHSPFCKHKCGYCDFNSWAEETLAPQKVWLKSLQRQLDFWKEPVGENKIVVDTIFWGGGTPTLIHSDLMLELSKTLKKTFHLDTNYEWTVECNPETLDSQKLEVLREMGVTRLSIGVQSFKDRYLQRLERQVSGLQNHKVLEMVAQKWSGPWSLDLMFALPGQSIQDWQDDLNQGLVYGPSHISAYQLTLSTERSKKWQQADEDELETFYSLTCEKMADHGLSRYEISNFAKSGRECLHNLKYWKIEPFLAVGPGGAGLLRGSLVNTLSENSSYSRFGVHQKNPDSFDKWSIGSGSQEEAWLSQRTAKDHVFEMLMMGLRLDEGILKERLSSPSIIHTMAHMQNIGLIEENAQFWRASEKGKRLLHTLLENLYARLEGSLDFENIDPTFT